MPIPTIKQYIEISYPDPRVCLGAAPFPNNLELEFSGEELTPNIDHLAGDPDMQREVLTWREWTINVLSERLSEWPPSPIELYDAEVGISLNSLKNTLKLMKAIKCGDLSLMENIWRQHSDSLRPGIRVKVGRRFTSPLASLLTVAAFSPIGLRDPYSEPFDSCFPSWETATNAQRWLQVLEMAIDRTIDQKELSQQCWGIITELNGTSRESWVDPAFFAREMLKRKENPRYSWLLPKLLNRIEKIAKKVLTCQQSARQSRPNNSKFLVHR